MFNFGKQKNIENYKKCLLLQEKYKTIEGVIRFHQDYLEALKVNPVDYWQSLIANYEKESKNENFSVQERETFKMALEEMRKLNDDYNSYYFNKEQKKLLEKKLTKEDIEQAQEEVLGLIDDNTKRGGQK